MNRRRLFRLLPALLLAPSLGCPGPDGADAGPGEDPRAVSAIEPVNPTGTVSGRVSDLFTQDDLADVTVTLLVDPSGEGRPTATTDGEGLFQLDDVPSSTDVALRFDKPGYASAWTTVSIPSSAGNLAQDNGVAFAGPIELIPEEDGVAPAYLVRSPDGATTDAARLTVTLDVRFVDDGAPRGQLSGQADYDEASGAFTVSGLPDLAGLAAVLPTAAVRTTIVPEDPGLRSLVLEHTVSTLLSGGPVEVLLESYTPFDAGPEPVADDTPLEIVDGNVDDLVSASALGLQAGDRPTLPSVLSGSQAIELWFSRPPEEESFFVSALDEEGAALDLGPVSIVPSEALDDTLVTVAAPTDGWPAGEEVNVLIEAFAPGPVAPLTRRGTFLTPPDGEVAFEGVANLVSGGQIRCPDAATAIVLELNTPVGSRTASGAPALDVAELLAIKVSSGDDKVPADNQLSDAFAGTPLTAALVEEGGFEASGYTSQLLIPWTGAFGNLQYPSGELSVTLQLTVVFNDLATSTTGGFGTGVVRAPGGAPVGTLSGSVLLYGYNPGPTACTP